MKIGSVGAELFLSDRRTGGQTGGWTDKKKLMVALGNFVNSPKN